MPLVYIVILTLNHRDMTADCLRSVLQMTYPHYRVVIVDNGSTDGTVEFVKERFPDVTVIANSRNLGFAAGCNVGIRHAMAEGADYVLLLNNDTLVPPDLLDHLIAQALPNAGILMPRISYSDEPGRLWFAGSRRHWLTLDARDFGPYGPRQIHDNELCAVDYVFGTAMLIRRAVLERVGLFDEAFFMYYEDMDFCLRVRAAGFELYYVPGVTVQHRVSASTSTHPPIRYYHKARSSVYFFRKHTQGARWLIIVPYRLGSAVCTVMRLLRQRQWIAVRAYLRGLADGLSAS
jgi:hypothetical protein